MIFIKIERHVRRVWAFTRNCLSFGIRKPKNTAVIVDSQKGSDGKSLLMENLMGLLRIRVKRGINLAVRDVRTSDPYVVIKMDNQVLFNFQF